MSRPGRTWRPSCRRTAGACWKSVAGRANWAALLKEHGYFVAGVELVAEAAEAARRHLDQVVTADVEADGLPFSPGSFDAVIFADVLEHLIDPWRVLREAAELLVPGGCVIASVPNVQNGDVIWRLLRGRWEYRERGILDRGHLRFFTLHGIRDLFVQAGLTVEHVGCRYRRTWLRETLCLLTGGRARAFYTRQYLVVGRKKEASGGRQPPDSAFGQRRYEESGG